MNLGEFNNVIRRLESAFNREMPDEQKDLWFEKLGSWSRHKFSKIAETIIDENDRFPVLSTILKTSSGFSNEAHVQNLTRTDCLLCEGSGHVTAKKDGYNTCFRCPQCRNWDGKLSEKIPQWAQEFFERGYRLETPDLSLEEKFSREKFKSLSEKMSMGAN